MYVIFSFQNLDTSVKHLSSLNVPSDSNDIAKLKQQWLKELLEESNDEQFNNVIFEKLMALDIRNSPKKGTQEYTVSTTSQRVQSHLEKDTVNYEQTTDSAAKTIHQESQKIDQKNHNDTPWKYSLIEEQNTLLKKPDEKDENLAKKPTNLKSKIISIPRVLSEEDKAESCNEPKTIRAHFEHEGTDRLCHDSDKKNTI